jgi:hypothetical protein
MSKYEVENPKEISTGTFCDLDEEIMCEHCGERTTYGDYGLAHATSPEGANPYFSDLDWLVRIFSFDDRERLEKYCRKLLLLPRWFTGLGLASDLSLIPLSHEVSHRDAEARPAPKDRFTDQCYKCHNKRKQAQRLAGHMFRSPDDRAKWHFFCFDQSDVVQRGHIKKGAHFRFINWLWQGQSAESVWSNFVGDEPSDAVHMRFSH